LKTPKKETFKMTETNLKVIKYLKTQGENRRCAECNAPSLYVVTKYGCIYVCHNCAGVHRIFVSGRYVKGLTTANFSAADVEAVRKGGNAVSKRYWMAKHPRNAFVPTPNASMDDLKRFIDMKYIQKTWVAGTEENYEGQTQQQTKKAVTPTKSTEQDDFFSGWDILKTNKTTKSKPNKTTPAKDLLKANKTTKADNNSNKTTTTNDLLDFFDTSNIQAKPSSNKPKKSDDLLDLSWFDKMELQLTQGIVAA
jgi:uncharacterized protein YuzB (UPF0349 family)